MNFIVACVIAATVSLQTVKLGTAPGKTMVVTGATVSAASEISEELREAVRTNWLCTVAAAEAAASSKLPTSGGTMSGDIKFARSGNDSTYGMRWIGPRGNMDYLSIRRAYQLGAIDFERSVALMPSRFYVSSLVPDGSPVATSNMVDAVATAKVNALPAWTKTATKPTYTAAEVGAASQAELTPIATDARNAYGFSRGTYLYMNANTNSWFAGTNYVFGADAATRTRFVWEEGMDAATVPCSMALNELRDGAKQCVWDQRDWTAWYWSFKAAQMNAQITAQMAASNAAVYAEMNSTNQHAWAKWYAASGRVNPDPTTTYVDTPKVCLAPGMNWESVAEVSGCGYWTIVANGLVVGGSGTNAVLQIKDFEGNAIMTITKGSHRLAWLEQEDFTGQMTDGNGWVCFSMMADSQPTGYFSTTLDADDFVVQTDANCPAQYTWEDLGNGEWRVHFLLKPGIVASTCFAKFMAEVQGQTKITYSAGAEISGGLIYNGTKIAPQIPAGASVGDTITWKVVQ